MPIPSEPQEQPINRPGIGTAWTLCYLFGSMALAMALSYFLSDHLITFLPPQNLFFAFFWWFLAIGILLAGRIMGRPIKRVLPISALVASVGVLCLFLGHLIFR
jgi:hypothetical protein